MLRFFAVVLTVLPIAVAVLCPLNCKCYRYSLQCRGASLYLQPEGLKVAEEKLEVVLDNFTILTRDLFRETLQKLSLIQTGTKQIEVNAFEGMTELRVLILENNRINFIHSDTFKGLIKLCVLNLHRNEINFLDPTTFQGLKSLNNLNMNTNNLNVLHVDLFRDMGHEFMLQEMESNSHLNLETLKLDSKLDFGENEIENIEPGMFQNLVMITELDMSKNKLRTLRPNSFMGLSNLWELALNSNPVVTIWEGAFNGLKKLKKLLLYNSNISNITSEMFVDLPHLLTLDLENNRIENIPEGTFKHLISLTRLKLSHNKLKKISSGTFCSLRRLTHLHLRQNYIQTIHTTTFAELQQLRYVDLEYNKLQSVSESLRPLRHLTYVTLRYNHVTVLANTTFNLYVRLEQLSLSIGSKNKFPVKLRNLHVNCLVLTLEKKVTISKLVNMLEGILGLESLHLVKMHTSLKRGIFPSIKIRHLYISEGNNYVIYADAFHNLPVLKTLEVSSSKLKRINLGAFNNLKRLSDLILRRNKIRTLERGLFNGLVSLEYLHLGKNSIKSLEEGIFSSDVVCNDGMEVTHGVELHNSSCSTTLTSLKYLDLTHNSIRFIHNRTFVHNHKLETLKLGFNRLLTLDTNFLLIPSLKFLYMNHCNISNIPRETFTLLRNLLTLDLRNNMIERIDIGGIEAFEELDELYIDNNPVNCDCQLLDTWALLWKLGIMQKSYNHDNDDDNDDDDDEEDDEDKDKDQDDYEYDDNYEDDVGDYYNDRDYDLYDVVCTNTGDSWEYTLQSLKCNSSQQPYEDIETRIFKVPPLHFDDDINLQYSTTNSGATYFKRYVEPSFLWIIFSTGILLNLMLLIVFIKHPKIRRGPNIYVLNLAIGDILSLVVNIAISYFDDRHVTWDLDTVFCKLFMGMRDVSVGLNIFSVVALCGHRYRLVVNSLAKRTGVFGLKKSTTKMLSLVFIWALSIGLAFPAFLTAKVDYMCLYSDPAVEYIQRTWSIQLFVYCVVPICTVTFLSARTALILKSSAQKIPGEQRMDWQILTRARFANMIIALTVIMCVSYIPNYLIRVLVVWCVIEPQSSLVFYLSFISYCLFFCSSCFNPLAFLWVSPRFRNIVCSYVKCCYKNESDTRNQQISCRNLTRSRGIMENNAMEVCVQ
ncbi:toll-like receptor 6 [Periplaneta americana]|uniref:toll-like receptor 6 n=1 Tax=Periplaneta americana TaxID=6978 RepID=UPI0037E9BDAE